MRAAFFGALLIAGGCAERPLTYRDLEETANRQQRHDISRPAPDTCRMADNAALVGAAGAAIDPATLPAGARVVCHDCSVTLDYRADRLNIELDEAGNVARLRCG